MKSERPYVHPDILRLCEKVDAKRARTVIDHMLKYGSITTEDLKNTYGYDHPPRAVRDVRENGIPLITFKVISSTTGRKIAAYRFDSPDNIRNGRVGGRIAFSKVFKNKLVEMYDSRCTINNEKLNPRYLQIDHRIPYEIAGNEADLSNYNEFMLLDASGQRSKSWSCENCNNFTEVKSMEICRSCFWAFPENYSHIAMEEERRTSIVWQKNETSNYDQIEKAAFESQMTVQDYIKLKLEN